MCIRDSLWALAAIVGVVEAAPIVTAGGVVAFVVVVVGVLLAGRALRRMTEPLDDLIDASSRIEAGDYTARVPVAGGGGMRSLTRAFNRMSEELQATDERRRAFLADVTHELRTPLTVIQGQLEAIEDGVYEADAERVAALLAQARQMCIRDRPWMTVSGVRSSCVTSARKARRRSSVACSSSLMRLKARVSERVPPPAATFTRAV